MIFFDIVSEINDNAREFDLKHKTYQNKARDCHAYAQLNLKIRYDKVHMPLLLNAGNKAYLNLHEGYRILGIKSKKFTR